MRKFGILLTFLFLTIFLGAQNFSRPGEWKKYKKEIFISGGTANFLGDLGGRDREGTDYSPVDLDFPVTKSTFGIGYRYKVQRWFNVTSKFSYALLQGDDKQTQDLYRNNRNLNFKSNLFELGGRIEIGYQSARAGNRYGIKKTLMRRMKNNNHNFFFFAGVSGIYFNPKGKSPVNGQWVKLYPLHTEGQGLPGGPKQYKRINVSMPFGAYYKAWINKKYTFGIEIAWHKTFTDYIDDVGGTYYDPKLLEEAYGPMSPIMADPGGEIIPTHSSPAADGTPAVRGDNEKDSYITLELTFGYTFKQKRRRSRLRSKF